MSIRINPVNWTVFCCCIALFTSTTHSVLATNNNYNILLNDVYGESHDLASYLESGKSVILNFSSTWCKPCWIYEQAGILEHVWYKYGPLGSDEVVIILLEADMSTEKPCMSGMEACNDFSYGNWAKKPYPVINLEGSGLQLNEVFQITRYPTIIGISSKDRNAVKLGQLTFNGWSTWIDGQNDYNSAITTEDDLESLRQRLIAPHDPILNKHVRNRRLDYNKSNQVYTSSEVMVSLKDLPTWSLTEELNKAIKKPSPLYINVYPNPCVESVHIQYSSPDEQSAKARLYTMSGRKIFEKKIVNQGSSQVLDVSRLKRGMYILEIEGELIYRTEKLFVVK